jgi:hypothetical protein
METQTEFPVQPPPPAPPKKPNTGLIIAIVLFVACCFCVGVVGLLFAFWDDILGMLGLNSLLPLLKILP